MHLIAKVLFSFAGDANDGGHVEEMRIALGRFLEVQRRIRDGL